LRQISLKNGDLGFDLSLAELGIRADFG